MTQILKKSKKQNLPYEEEEKISFFLVYLYIYIILLDKATNKYHLTNKKAEVSKSGNNTIHTHRQNDCRRMH